MNEKFGERLDAALIEKGMTKYRLAQLTGLSQAHVGNLVMGKRAPTDEVLSKIAPVLGLSVAEMKAWAILDEANDSEVREELRKQLQTLDGGLDVPDDIEDEPDDWEREVLLRTGAATAHDYSSQSDFWYLPKEERRAILENLDEIWRENEALMKKMRKRG